MKKIIFILLLAFTLNTQAQADYFTDCTNVAGMDFDRSVLYFIQRGTNDGIVSKIDVSDATPTRIDVVTNLTDPVDIVLNGNDLYVLSRLDFLCLVDLTQTNPTPTELLNVTISDYANFRSIHLTLHDSYLYITLLDEGKLNNLNCSLKTYQFSIGKNLIYETLRKNNKIQNSEIFLFKDEYGTCIEEDVSSRKTKQQQLLVSAISQLGKVCQDILKLFYYNGYTLEEIKDTLKYVSKDVVKSQKSRCVSKLKKTIKNG